MRLAIVASHPDRNLSAKRIPTCTARMMRGMWPDSSEQSSMSLRTAAQELDAPSDRRLASRSESFGKANPDVYRTYDARNVARQFGAIFDELTDGRARARCA